jgi:diguanylate cyclase (GGDEF)-like protein/PAS domain S-box-containing protein
MVRVSGRSHEENLESVTDAGNRGFGTALRLVAPPRGRSDLLLQAVLDNTSEMVFLKDAHSRYVLVNRAFASLYGLTPDECVGRDDRTLIGDPELVERIHAADRHVLTTGEGVQVQDALMRDGRTRHYLIAKTPYRDEHGRIVGIVGIATDVTHMKIAEDRLLHDALHDSLTGLPNRALFLEELQLAVDRRRRRRDRGFTVLFLDLDRFKVINDSLGHLAGDALLVELGSRIADCVRPGDLVARLGGDEFTILLDGLEDATGATRIADRIQVALVAPFVIGGREVFTSASIGIALSHCLYDDPAAVLRDADLAMYRAKAQGGARYEVFDAGMHASALARLELETDLRRALERGEFRLRYQPIYAADGSRLVAFEALLRWEHPRRGLLTPDAFLVVAEETNLTVPLGAWVISEACRQLAAWGSPTLQVAVNVSHRQLLAPGLVAVVRRALEASLLAPERLTLEITETVLMQDADAGVAVLADLKALGVRLAMDDFGTGYSSLSYLRRFPLDGLKIDREFVSRMHERANFELVRTVIHLARNLRLDIVAEGVEDAEQWGQLRALACDMVQGHFFSAPLDPEAAGRLLAAREQPGRVLRPPAGPATFRAYGRQPDG